MTKAVYSLYGSRYENKSALLSDGDGSFPDLSRRFFSSPITHFEEADHQEECFVCDLISSVCFDSSEKSTSFIAFEKNTHEREFLIFIKKSFYFQLFPRPPPLKNI